MTNIENKDISEQKQEDRYYDKKFKKLEKKRKKQAEKRQLKEQKNLDKLQDKKEKQRIKDRLQAVKKLNKKNRNLRKQFQTTVDWIEVDEVTDDYISIKNGEYVLFGIKIIPPKITLESDEIKESWLAHLALVMNSMEIIVYNETIMSPIDVSIDIMRLQQKMAETDSKVLKRSFLNEIELLDETSRNMRAEYYVLGYCKPKNEKYLQKFDELVRRYKSERFRVEKLTRNDYMNYIAFKFKNEYIYDYYQPRALFETLDEKMVYINEKGEVVNDAIV